jgi:6-phosphofructokinase 1
LYTAYRLQKFGFNIIGVPKSIDNDLECTDFTFGFHTAVEIANEAINRLHTTATSHDRIMILEVMGRTAGWIALYAGIAGGANMILIPEIPYDYSKVLDFIDKRYTTGHTSAIIVVAEAAIAKDGSASMHNWGTSGNSLNYGGSGESLAQFINGNTEFEARSTALGHIQRGGSPNAFDKILSTQLGAYAAEMFKKDEFGMMAAYVNNQIRSVSLGDSVLSLKLVSPDSQIVRLAKNVEISFGA